jgi:tetratricopeptide (TPR) repeat protein
VGLAWWEKDGLIVEQYFMRNHSEEPSLLLGILERLRQRRVLVTYNGKSFDWPLLQTRFQMTRVGEVPDPLAHLDLLHPARQIWRLRIGSVALERVERRILHVDRGQDIPSSTIPQRYFDFLRGGSPDAVAEVFYHNQWDLFGLASLAVHMLSMLENPQQSDCCPEELFGLSRLLQRRGEEHLAADMYQAALQGGLPAEAEQIAQRELAVMAKRASNFELSNALWEKLLDYSNEGLRAYEQLAIYYEHRASAYDKAAGLCRNALVRLQESFHEGNISSLKYQQWHASFEHRLNRLKSKISRQSAVGSRQ